MLSKSEIEEELNATAERFTVFAQQMHFLKSTPEHEFQFFHLKLRDFFAVPGLLEVLRDQENLVRSMAAEALGKIGDAGAVPGLLEALRDPKYLVRSFAAEALGRIGEPAVPGLVKALHDPKEDVRWSAVVALKEILISKHL